MHFVSPHDPKLERSPTVAAYGLDPRTRATTASESVDYAPSWSTTDRRPSGQPRRFVAGTTFFNYDAFGSLRPTEEPIQLFSRQYFGLAVHVLLCGFSFYFFSYGYGRLLAEYLKANDDRQVKAANYVLVWPSALSVLVGLVSDLFSVWSYRRKAYMLLGWCLSLVMYLVLVTMDAFSDSGNLLYATASRTSATGTGSSGSSRFAWAYIAVSLLAAIGIQIAWVSAVAASVEFAQREHIHHRGRLQATLLVVYYFGAFLAQTLAACVIDEGATSDTRLVARLSIGRAATILAAVALLAFPFVLLCYHEDPCVHTPRVDMPLRDRLQSFWKLCHRNVVYRVLFFAVLHLLLIGQFNQNARDAVQQWSGVTRDGALTIDAARPVANLVTVFVWKNFLRNVSWRVMVFWGSSLYIATYCVLTVVTTLDVIRNEWFYAAMIMVTEIPRGWLLLFTFVLATEIADVGHEGVTVGLTISFQALAGLTDFTLGALYPDLLGFKVSETQVKEDAPTTRAHVIKAFGSIAVVTVLCLAVIRLVPQQKLDAQQLRAFGGYNKYASSALAILFAVLLSLNLAANLMVVL